MARADTYTQSDLTKDLYSDFMNDLTPHPNTNSIVLLKNVNAVSRSIKNLILTNKYERPYNPKIGSNIRAFLFEPADAITANSMRTEIELLISKYEPRAMIEDVIVNASQDENSYEVSIIYSIKNVAEPIRLDLTLYRVR